MAEHTDNNLSSTDEGHQDKLYYEDQKDKEERWGSRDSNDRSPRNRSYKEGSPQEEQPSQNEGNNLHVSNIPKDITEDELRKIFSEYGKVLSVSIPKDPRNGIGRGFGFVKMDTIEEAQKAIQRVQELYPKYTIQLSKRSKPRASTPGQYLGSDKSRRSHHDSRRYDVDRYDRHYDRRYREYSDDRNDRYEGYRASSYRNYDRGVDRGYDRYHNSSYSRSHYDDYDYHNRPPYDYGYDDRYRGYSVSERDRYYSRFGPYHRAPSGEDHHHHHSSPGRD